MNMTVAAVSDLHAELWDAGFRPVPVFNADARVTSPGKQPLGKQWQLDARRDPPFCATAPAVAHALNTGILADGLRPIDLDIDDPDKARRCRALATAILGEAPTRIRQGSSRSLMLYRAASGAPAKRTLAGASHTKDCGCKIEVLGCGQQFVAFGRHHPSGADLTWFPEAPGHERREALPVVTEDQIQAFLEACAPILDAPMPGRPNGGASNGHGHDHASGDPQADILRIAAALANIPNNGVADWEDWNRVGMAVWRATEGSAAGWEAFNAWSARNEAYDPKATRARWDHYATSPPAAIGAGTLFHMARQAHPMDSDDRPKPNDSEPPQPNAETEAGKRPSATDLANDTGLITEDSVALAFERAHRHELRFDHHVGKWYRWTGTAWRKEETRLAFCWARQAARRLARESDNNKAMLAAGKAAFAAGVERFAQAERAFAVTSELWDADPWLLGTPGGTVDLRTGELRPAAQTDYITKLTAVTPAETADCPLWLAFLKEATNGDDALIGFLRRWFGYTLTGITKEHALLFVFGDGGNGKGVCLGTVAGIMGNYAVTAVMDTFTATTSDRHTTDMAMLAGARMVLTTETEEGRYWAEARLKTLTGGDPVTARFMRRDNFTFMPAFKLTVSGNHKPALRNVDVAARRRFNLAPFLHRPEKPDRDLPETLKAEGPAILRWMIEGCLEWQRDGLQQPDVVKLATEAYFSEQDVIRQWVEDCCNLGSWEHDTQAALFKSWTDYAIANGEKPGTSKWFTQTLERLGCEKLKNTPGQHGKRGFSGIAVRPIKTEDRTEPRSSADPDEPPF